jgi:hypothetical protein
VNVKPEKGSLPRLLPISEEAKAMLKRLSRGEGNEEAGYSSETRGRASIGGAKT